MRTIIMTAALLAMFTAPAFAYVDDDGGGVADPSGDGEAPDNDGGDGGGISGTFTAPGGGTYDVEDFTPRDDPDSDHDDPGEGPNDDLGNPGGDPGRDPVE